MHLAVIVFKIGGLVLGILTNLECRSVLCSHGSLLVLALPGEGLCHWKGGGYEFLGSRDASWLHYFPSWTTLHAVAGRSGTI